MAKTKSQRRKHANKQKARRRRNNADKPKPLSGYSRALPKPLSGYTRAFADVLFEYRRSEPITDSKRKELVEMLTREGVEVYPLDKEDPTQITFRLVNGAIMYASFDEKTCDYIAETCKPTIDTIPKFSASG